MGRKGVSKRKPSQNKSKEPSTGAASGNVSSLIHATEVQPAKTPDTGYSTRSSGKTSSDRKNKSK